jgi:hypothetical protein
MSSKLENLPFKVGFPRKMNDRERLRWLPIIRLVYLVSEQQGIEFVELNFHHHVPPRRGWSEDHHELGEADLDDKIITLCSKDYDTALHELAHIWTDTFHTEKWARAYIKLLLIYMMPAEAEYHIALNSTRYPAFRKAEDRRRGKGNKVPPPPENVLKQG